MANPVEPPLMETTSKPLDFLELILNNTEKKTHHATAVTATQKSKPTSTQMKRALDQLPKNSIYFPSDLSAPRHPPLPSRSRA